jgi:WW domain-containing oxidoreductase
MSLVGLIKGRRGPSGFGYASSAEEVTEGIDLEDKTVVITGVSSGLGQETARVLAMRGAHIVGLARTLEKAETACSSIGAATTPVACELADLESARDAARAIAKLDRSIDVVIANAGIMALPERQSTHGVELQLLTNHIGHFVLITELLGSLAEHARVVMVSSSAHKMAPRGGIQFDNLDGRAGYRPWRAYGQSKLANILFAVELAHRFEGSKRTANAVHPGVIRTNLSRHMSGVANVLYAASAPLFAKTIPQGAATSCYVASHPDAAAANGEYFVDCNVAVPSHYGRDPELAAKLWDVSEEIARRILGETQAA